MVHKSGRWATRNDLIKIADFFDIDIVPELCGMER